MKTTKQQIIPIALFIAAAATFALSSRNPSPQSVAYVPDQTDVRNYKGMEFAVDHEDSTTPAILLKEFNWWILMESLLPSFLFEASPKPNTPIDIRDARKVPGLSLEKNGFTIVDLDNGQTQPHFEPGDWSDSSQVNRFHHEVVVPRLKKQFPNATRFEYLKAIRRGGRKSNPPPILNGVHTDFLDDVDVAGQFYKKHEGNKDEKREMVLAAQRTREIRENSNAERQEILEAIVTFWKPINMNTPVCDFPLAFMDAKGFRAEDERPYEFHVDFWPFVKVSGISGAPAYRPESQSWYYYPFMTTSEGLFLIQHSVHKFFKSPHAAFENPNCPPGFETRQSFDYRVLVYSDQI